MLDFGPEHLCSFGGAFGLSMFGLKYFAGKVLEKVDVIPEIQKDIVRISSKLEGFDRIKDLLLEHDRKIVALEALKNGNSAPSSIGLGTKHRRPEESCT